MQMGWVRTHVLKRSNTQAKARALALRSVLLQADTTMARQGGPARTWEREKHGHELLWNSPKNQKQMQNSKCSRTCVRWRRHGRAIWTLRNSRGAATPLSATLEPQELAPAKRNPP